MKHIQIILLCFIVNFAKGQTVTEWFPIGAEWYYSNPNNIIGIRQQCIKYLVTKDTTWEGVNCKQIKISSCIGDTVVEIEYFKQDGLQIKYLNFASNQFYVLYDFSKSVGDTITVHDGKFVPNKSFFSPFDTLFNFKYTIKKIENTNINGFDLKKQNIETIEQSAFNFMNYWSDSTYNNSIIERIGAMTNFTGNFRGVIPESYFPFLRCYNDLEVNFKLPYWTNNCNFVTLISNELSKYELIQLFPNPQNRGQSVKINSNEDFKIITIMSSTGQVVPFTINDNLIKINSDEVGIYFIQILTGNNIINRKIILL
jgi:hypothetical protein